MSEFDDDFLLRPGKSRTDRTGQSAANFVGQVRRAVQKASDPGPGARRTGKGRGAARLGRGAGRAPASGQASRRVVIKARIVRHAGGRFRAAPIARHITYLQREGVTRDETSPQMFDARSERADVAAFAERCEDDRHHFRFIVSPQDAGAMADLRAFTRELMDQAQADLGTRLDWVAIDHWNTDNPHLHILVRGRGDDDKDLVIAGDYIAGGLRERAQRLVTLELGPRSEHEINLARDADVRADRYTDLDRALLRAASPSDLRVDLSGKGSDEDRRLLGRVAHLEKLGLAEPAGPGGWRLAPDLEPRLRDLSIRNDIIKTYHQAMARSGREAAPERLVIQDPNVPSPIVGRLVERGLADELKGTAYVIVDGVDGRQHHLSFADLDKTTDARPGAIVELRGYSDRAGVQRHALVVRSDFSLEAQVQAEGATWLDRQILSRSTPSAIGGFGGELADAAQQRAAVLVARGLGSAREGAVTLAPKLLETLQARELASAAERISRETGRPAKVAVPGEAVAGVYQRRLDLASGRFAVLDDGLGFQLVPWRAGLEPHRGQSISGAITPGGVDWALGHWRGLGR